MDRNYTTAIKGFAILTVVWAHVGASLSIGGIQFIAGIGVSLFLICSGYGLQASFEKNGLKGFWKKRLLSVCLPFWTTELIGLLVTGAFSVKVYLLDFIFVKPATGYGWFMGYIVICYLVFFMINRFVSDEKMRIIALFVAFSVWFVLDSVFFANPDMPFIRARQMMSFPCGVLLAMNKDKTESTLTKTKSVLTLVLGGTVCVVFMVVTQLQAVKELPYLATNAMALLTCFPMAIGILAFGKSFGKLFENKVLLFVGTISYEIYLVHAFTLAIVKGSIVSICLFVIFTFALAYILHIVMRIIKHDRLNSSYIDKK